MADRDVAPTVVSASKRRMLRRLRSHWRHEQFSIRVELVSATHHSHMRVANVSTHTDDDVPAATCAATATPTPVIECVAPAPPVTYATPVPVIKHVAPASAATYTVPSPVTEYVAPAPAVTCATPAPETDHVTRSLVIECIAPAPAVTFSTPSQLLPPAYIMESVTTGVSLDTTGLVNLHCPITAAAPHVDGSLPPLGVSAAPVYNQVRQEQIRSRSTLWKVSRRSAGGSAFRNALWSRLSMLLLCVGDTGSNIVTGRLCEVIRIGFGFYADQVRALYAHEDPDNFRSGYSGPQASAPAFEDLMKILTERRYSFAATAERKFRQDNIGSDYDTEPGSDTETDKEETCVLPDENIIAVGGCVEVWTVYEMASACPGRHTNTGPTAACCVAYPSFGFVRDDQRVRHVRGEPSLVILCSSAADPTTLPFSAT